jgi:hypothetical protein
VLRNTKELLKKGVFLRSFDQRKNPKSSWGFENTEQPHDNVEGDYTPLFLNGVSITA